MRRVFEQKGFTLIEVLTGVVLASIIASSSMPSVAAIMAQYRLISASSIIGAEIARARTQASAEQRFVCVFVEQGAISRQVAETAATQCSSTGTPPEITELLGVTTSRAEVRFDPNGLAVVRNSVKVANQAGSKVVITSVLGKVAVL